MKAIPTAELCIACHGEAIAPDVAAALDQAYPDDKARGVQARRHPGCIYSFKAALRESRFYPARGGYIGHLRRWDSVRIRQPPFPGSMGLPNSMR